MLKRFSLLLFAGLVCAFCLAGAVFGQTIIETPPDSGGDFRTPSAFKEKQTGSAKKRPFEFGVQFTSLMRDGDGDRNGFGGRFTYDFATFGGGKYVAALDTEVNYLPGERFVFTPRSDGRVFQGFAGLKIGRKWEKFGIFAKGRPGFTQYSRGKQIVTGTNANPVFGHEPETNFATDVGGIFEFYPTKRFTTRFDFGDTMVRYGRQNTTFYDFNNNTITPVTFPSGLKHNFQFSAGIGFRF